MRTDTEKTRFTFIEGQIESGSMSEEMATELANLAINHASFLVTGKAFSGKTSVLTSIVNCIGAREKIITFGYNAHALFDFKNFDSVNFDLGSLKKADMTATDLFQRSLRMRADRYVVDDLQDEIALDALHSNSVGHDGCILALNASSPQRAISKLNLLAKESAYSSGHNTERLVRENVNIILLTKLFENGIRRVVEVNEMRIVNDNSKEMSTTPLWKFDHAEGKHIRVNEPSSALMSRLKLDASKYLSLEEINARLKQGK